MPYFNNIVTPITLGNITINVPDNYLEEVVIVPYGTEFLTLQSLCEFIAGYGVYLESLGMQFNDIENNVAITWNQMITELIYWYNSGWEVGSTINVNPNANLLTVDTGLGVVDSLKNYTNSVHTLFYK